MNILLSDSVFRDTANTMRLHSLAVLSLDRLHRILIEDDQAAGFLAWMAGLDSHQRDVWREVLQSSVRQEAREPSRRQILIDSVMFSDWNVNPPVLTIADGCKHATEPFTVLLEDEVSDKHFLLKVASPQQRDALKDREAAGSLRFDNGGVITSMPRKVEAFAASGKSATSRLWVLFDSDALRRDKPSRNAINLLDKCKKHDVEYHRLRRRNIENYIPKHALHFWAFRSVKGAKRKRKNMLNSYVSMNEEQRHHYNMKDGFDGDRNRADGSAGDLYIDISTSDRRHLKGGFGTHIASLYEDDCIIEDHLRNDESWSELNSAINNLVALSR